MGGQELLLHQQLIPGGVSRFHRVPGKSKVDRDAGGYWHGHVAIPHDGMDGMSFMESPGNLHDLIRITHVNLFIVVCQLDRHITCRLRPHHDRPVVKFLGGEQRVTRHAGLVAEQEENLAIHTTNLALCPS